MIRSVVKVRDGNETTWPPPECDAAPSFTVTGEPPSKVSVALVIHWLTW